MAVRRVVAVAALAASLVAGCTPPTSQRATIDVDAPVALADQPVHVRITELNPHEQITVSAQATDARTKEWRAQATFEADAKGVVDLQRDRPTSGTYAEVDGMGMFWSMQPPDGDPDLQLYVPPRLGASAGQELRLTVTGHGRTLGTRTLTRQWLAPGVTTRPVTAAGDGVSGRLFLPPPASVRRPAVLVVGGSEGGLSQTATAGLLASHGYPALTVAYFHAPGLPPMLRDIPLEYFATAARLLARQSGVDPARLVMMGSSRGAEAALLVAQNFPDLVHGAVLYAPSAVVNPGFPEPATNAWTLDRVPVPQTLIPVDHVNGPVLAVAGAQDGVWSAASAADLIVHELTAARHPSRHEALVYAEAGHNVGTYPYQPQGTRVIHPFTGTEISLGGTRPGAAAAQADSWAKVLVLLASLQR